jgi:hypothetical protein
MNRTQKSLLFWITLVVVGVSIYNLASVFERMEAQRGGGEAPLAEVDPAAKLKELGIVLAPPTAPIANYVNAVRTGDLLFLAGKGFSTSLGT